MPPKIRLELSAPIAEMILNKPEKRNALSSDMWAAIPGIVAEFERADDAKVMIIHGGDAGAFAAGADISEFAKIYETSETTMASRDNTEAALYALENCTKPVLAAIDGACVGGGVSLAMCADIRFASERSKFGVTPAKLGIVYPASHTRRLLDCLGESRTKDLLFSGRIFAAEEAARIGLVDHLISDGDALSAARDYAANICKNSQWSARATKKMIRGLQSGWSETGAEVAELTAEAFSNDDFAEGHKAFLEKRPAKFTL